MDSANPPECGEMTPVRYWIATAVCAVVLLLTLGNLFLSMANRERRAEVEARAQRVQRAALLDSLYRDLLRDVAELAARHDDLQLRRLAENHGVMSTLGAAAARL